MIYTGEDILSVRIGDPARRAAVVAALRRDDIWAEVVAGMADVTVRYDPAFVSIRQAQIAFTDAIAARACEERTDMPAIALPARFDAACAPDAALVAARLGIGMEMLPDWITTRSYRVAMMGFQPGFAYLEDCCDAALPEIPRLAVPRQQVAAGSIGLLGSRACIYALDGPGGWPIVGRVTQPIIQPQNSAQPFLLDTAMAVKFLPHDDSIDD